MSNQIAQDYARQVDEGLKSIIEDTRAYGTSDLANMYVKPSEEDWSVMEDLAHVVEFPPYWTKEMLKVIKNPGTPFGRTHADADRIAAINAHAQDDLETTLERLENARKETVEMLLTINDEEWEKTGVHSTRGVMNLHQIMERFITSHLGEHVQQAKDALQAVKSKT
jgi:hypothetical protein